MVLSPRLITVCFTHSPHRMPGARSQAVPSSGEKKKPDDKEWLCSLQSFVETRLARSVLF